MVACRRLRNAGLASATIFSHTDSCCPPSAIAVTAAGFVGPQTPIIACLRQELFNTPYDSIDWDSHRNTVADIDLYAPHTW